MSQFTDLIEKVKEENLDKWQLEDYHTKLSALYADMQIRLGELEKQEALFISKSEEKTVAGAKRIWDVTETGLEEIELKRKVRACEKLLSSIKNRLYSTY